MRRANERARKIQTIHAGRKGKKKRGGQNTTEGKEVMNEGNENRGGESSSVKWKPGWDTDRWL